MPRHARLDAPGTLHHVMGRGLKRQRFLKLDWTGRILLIAWPNSAGEDILPSMPGP